MAKKTKELSLEEKLEQILVPVEEQPYEVPGNWCWTFHNSLIDISGGAQPAKSYFVSEPTEGYTQLYQTRDYGEKPVPVYIPDKYATKTTEEGDILLARYGGSLGKVFRAHKGAYNVALAKVIPLYPSLVDDEYLYLYYLSDFYQNFCIKAGKGRSAQAGYNRDDMAELPFPLPPLVEQKRIVKVIESMFAKLDEAKEIAEEIVESYEQQKLSIFNKAFSGELTCNREYKTSAQNTIKEIADYAESITKKDKANIQTFQNQVQYIGMQDGRIWAKTQIGAIGIVTNGSTPSRKCPEYWDGDIPWVSSGEVRNNEICFTNEKITQEGYDNSSVKLLPKGTVLIAMIGEGKTRGQSAVLSIEATTNQNIAAIVIEHGMIESKYLWYWLQMQYRKNREKGSGSGPQALNCQRVRELEISVPSIEEQRDIVKVLDSIMKKEDAMLNVAEQTIESIESMKKSILAKAFRGELGTNVETEESSLELLKQILEVS